jgi:hypothetical protein
MSPYFRHSEQPNVITHKFLGIQPCLHYKCNISQMILKPYHHKGSRLPPTTDNARLRRYRCNVDSRGWGFCLATVHLCNICLRTVKYHPNHSSSRGICDCCLINSLTQTGTKLITHFIPANHKQSVLTDYGDLLKMGSFQSRYPNYRSTAATAHAANKTQVLRLLTYVLGGL